MTAWPMIAVGIGIGFILLLVPILSRIRRTRGTNAIYHLIYIVTAVCLLLLLPETIQDLAFSVGRNCSSSNVGES